ncbi:MAG: glycosyltransferase family 2 protein [Enterobacteriaceae bacterium]
MGKLLARSQQQGNRDKGELPFVSVVCPTYERKQFLPYLLYIYQSQDYPADRRELVILDDSPQSSEQLIMVFSKTSGRGENIRYIHHPERLALGKKRNMLNELARGEYIVCMDDDDYYPVDKLSFTIRSMQSQRALLSGSDQILIWYSHLDKIYLTHPFGAKHAPNGTFAYHRNYLKKHRYQDELMLAEEGSFTEEFSVPIQQLPPERTILCISHNYNTYDKDFIMHSCTLTPYKLSDIVQDKRLLNYYQRLSQSPIISRIPWTFFASIVILETDSASGDAQLQQLLQLGVPQQQIVRMPAGAPDNALQESEAHLAVLQRAQAEGWHNYLLLHSQLQWVKQERSIQSLNELLSSLQTLPWEVILLGGEYQNVRRMQSMRGVVKVNALHQACAYGVNRDYYATLLAHFQQGIEHLHSEPDNPEWRLDRHWKDLSWLGRWLGLYPSMAYLEYAWDVDSGKIEDATYRFFYKIPNRDQNKHNQNNNETNDE